MASSPESSRHHQVKAEFLLLTELGPAERVTALARLAERDRPLHDEVRSLLEHEADDAFLKRPLDLGGPAEAEVPRSLPTRIGPFHVLSWLGSGATGVVYLAEEEQPRRLVALKVLRPEAGAPNLRRRFEQEAQVLARLQHPGIAQVFGTGVATTDLGDLPYIAMEYVEGSPIDRHVRRQLAEVEGSVDLLVQACAAVQHAHDRGVLHRDLKPDNLLVDGEGRVRVVDFGVARLLDELPGAAELRTRTGAVLGTPSYMAPEQARGDRIDGRADLFALASVLYELITGHLPYDDRELPTREALLTLGLAAWRPPTDYVPDLSADLVTVLTKALALDRGERYASVREFGEDLRRWRAGLPVRARPWGRLYAARKFVQRHRVLSTVVGGTILVLCLALFVTLRAVSRLGRANETVRQLADHDVCRSLVQRADALWPVRSTALPLLDAWLRDADSLLARMPEHEHWLRVMEDRPEPGDRSLGMPDRGWLRNRQLELVRELQDLRQLASTVASRRRLAAEMRTRTLEEPARAWEAAVARVLADPRFRGYELAPQEGLVPLGPDPRSGLEEFALYGLAGPLPERGADGKLVLEEFFAPVLVLVPGGLQPVGEAVAEASEDLHVPPGYHEVPARPVRLDPFLVSKFELTQGQWLAFTGENPSYWEAGSTHRSGALGDFPFDMRHPVEDVTHEEAERTLAQMGLLLPTEAQWEHAARGGTVGRYWWGPDFEDAGRYENLKDLGGDDRWLLHAPVGSLPPNPFGLHDVLGNVSELCRDPYKVDYLQRAEDGYVVLLRDGDGLTLADGGRDRSRRGGTFTSSYAVCRVTLRSDSTVDYRSATNGVRPIRPLAP